jgi:hypothetical protein
MSYEDKARSNHRNGYNCAMSVYIAYADKLGLTDIQARDTAPKPRSEGGKCGAFLAGKAILEKFKPSAIPEYEEMFIELNGQTECSHLVAAHGTLKKSCNDYVGDVARIVGDFI